MKSDFWASSFCSRLPGRVMRSKLFFALSVSRRCEVKVTIVFGFAASRQMTLLMWALMSRPAWPARCIALAPGLLGLNMRRFLSNYMTCITHPRTTIHYLSACVCLCSMWTFTPVTSCFHVTSPAVVRQGLLKLFHMVCAYSRCQNKCCASFCHVPIS